MILKIDLEKAFNLIEWSYIRDALHFFNFPTKLTSLFMSCVNSISISIIVDGEESTTLHPLGVSDRET